MITYTMTESVFELIGEDGIQTGRPKPLINDPSTERSGLKSDGENNSAEILSTVLQTRNPHIIFKALTDLGGSNRNGAYFCYHILRSLPTTTFSEILQYLNPNALVGQFLKSHREISPSNWVIRCLKPFDDDKSYHACTNFMNQIQLIVSARLSAGLVLSLVDYKHLLRCARAVGNVPASHSVWAAMLRSAFKPDTECYNNRLAAMVWADVKNGSQPGRLRVASSFARTPKRSYPYYKVLGPSYKFQKRTIGRSSDIMSQVRKVFDHMVKNGVLGDEETFSLMIVAMARAGESGGVDGILAKVWDIDVPRLMVSDIDVEPVEAYQFGSPFRPSETLLLAVAHAYGINNQIPTALRLVDFISKSYSITIPLAVWEELLERTYVLCGRNYRRFMEEFSTVRRLPLQAVPNLWSTLVAEPYNVKPTMAMYNWHIRALIRLQKFRESQRMLKEARLLHMQNVHKYANSISSLNRRLSVPEFLETVHLRPLDSENSNFTRATLADLAREKQFRYDVMQRSRQCLCGLVNLFLRILSMSRRKLVSCAAMHIPQFLLEFKSYIPQKIGYHTTTGYVVFKSGRGRENEQRVQRMINGRRRPNLKMLWISHQTKVAQNKKHNVSRFPRRKRYEFKRDNRHMAGHFTTAEDAYNY
jgi:Mitochondrial ATPase expression